MMMPRRGALVVGVGVGATVGTTVAVGGGVAETCTRGSLMPRSSIQPGDICPTPLGHSMSIQLE